MKNKLNMVEKKGNYSVAKNRNMWPFLDLDSIYARGASVVFLLQYLSDLKPIVAYVVKA
jgi:hypothetical protein